MKIWIIRGDINGRFCLDAEDELNNSSSLYNFHSKDAVSDWKEIKVTFTLGKRTRDTLPINNITMFWSSSNLFVCDEHARELISKRFSDCQFLKIRPIEKEISEKTNYYLVNVLTKITGLNESKSEINYLNNRYFMGIEKHSFYDNVKDYPIFYLRVNDNVSRKIYVTDEFKNYVEECGITGFTFQEVFDFDNKEG